MRHYFTNKHGHKTYLYSVDREPREPKFPSKDIRYEGHFRVWHRPKLWFNTVGLPRLRVNRQFHKPLQCPGCSQMIKVPKSSLDENGQAVVVCPHCYSEVVVSRTGLLAWIRFRRGSVKVECPDCFRDFRVWKDAFDEWGKAVVDCLLCNERVQVSRY